MSDAADFVADRTKDFTGRSWVFHKLEAWLAAARPARFLLVGGPGSGKSAVAARLVQFSQGAAAADTGSRHGPGRLAFFHFCRALAPRSLSPLIFVQDLSRALANRHKAFREALLQVGDRNVSFNVVQNVGAADTVTGVTIQDLHVSNLTSRAAFDHIVRGPLEALCGPGFRETILILVDGLDESLTYDPDDTIVALLGHARDLPENVRFILTSRPDERVTGALGPAALDLIVNAPDDTDDVRDYAYRRLDAYEDPQRGELADRIATAGKGNFLFARYVLDDLPEDIAAGTDMIRLELPGGLDDIYRQFVGRELGKNKERWSERYRPILGAIAVARGDGLTPSQLAEITGVTASHADDVLRACMQFLTAQGETLRIYHQSFREFLLEDEEFHVYPGEANLAIAKFFQSAWSGTWQDCGEDYAIRYTPGHLVDALRLLGGGQRLVRQKLGEDLVALLSDLNYLTARIRIERGSTVTFEQDYARAVDQTPEGDARRRISLFANALKRESQFLHERFEDSHVQLYNRLYGGGSGSADELLRAYSPKHARPWLRSIHGLPVDPALRRTLYAKQRESHTTNAVAVTPDGRRAVSGGWDGVVRVWDLDAGQMLNSWSTSTTKDPQDSSPEQLHVSPDASQVVTKLANGAVVLWDRQTATALRKWTSRREKTLASAVTKDWRHLLLTTSTGHVVVVDLGSGQELRRWALPAGKILLLDIAQGASAVVGCLLGGALYKWKLDLDSEAKTLPGLQKMGAARSKAARDEDPPEAISSSEDGTRIIVGHDSGKLRCWDGEAGGLLWETVADRVTVCSTAISSARKLAISGGADSCLHTWDLETGEERTRLFGHTGHVLGLAAPGDGRHVVSVGGEGAVRLWNVTAGTAPNRRKGHQGKITSMVMWPDGSKVISGGEDGAVRLWDCATSSILHAWSEFKDQIQSVALVGEATVLAAGDERHLVCWDANTGRVVRKWEIRIDEGIETISPGEDAATVWIGGTDGSISLWDLKKNAPRFRMETGSSGIAALVPCDRGEFLSADSGGDVILWSLQAEQPRRTNLFAGGENRLSNVEVMTVAPDHSRLAIGDIAGQIGTWDLKRGQMSTIGGHVNYVRGLAVTPDSRLLLSGGWDGTLRLWDLETSREIGRYAWELPIERCVVGAKDLGAKDQTVLAAAGDAQGNVLFFSLDGDLRNVGSG